MIPPYLFYYTVAGCTVDVFKHTTVVRYTFWSNKKIYIYFLKNK